MSCFVFGIIVSQVRRMIQWSVLLNNSSFCFSMMGSGQEGMDGEAAMMIFRSPYNISNCECAATKLRELCVFV